jgi:RimJ/RimL family protein N-acetyltransferase
VLHTDRLRLKPWQECHREAFALLHADPIVMADQGGPLTRAESDTKLDRYRIAFKQTQICRWAVETLEGDFLGYSGVMMRLSGTHPLGPHYDLGWRLVRSAWGHGFATESARAALDHAFLRLGVHEILAYTSETNLRSQAVMRRLRLRRDSTRDFEGVYDGLKYWRGLVWVATSDVL